MYVNIAYKLTFLTYIIYPIDSFVPHFFYWKVVTSKYVCNCVTLSTTVRCNIQLKNLKGKVKLYLEKTNQWIAMFNK